MDEQFIKDYLFYKLRAEENYRNLQKHIADYIENINKDISANDERGELSERD